METTTSLICGKSESRSSLDDEAESTSSINVGLTSIRQGVKVEICKAETIYAILENSSSTRQILNNMRKTTVVRKTHVAAIIKI